MEFTDLCLDGTQTDEHDLQIGQNSLFSDTYTSIDHKEEFLAETSCGHHVIAGGRFRVYSFILPEGVMERPSASATLKPEVDDSTLAGNPPGTPPAGHTEEHPGCTPIGDHPDDQYHTGEDAALPIVEPDSCALPDECRKTGYDDQILASVLRGYVHADREARLPQGADREARLPQGADREARLPQDAEREARLPQGADKLVTTEGLQDEVDTLTECDLLGSGSQNNETVDTFGIIPPQREKHTQSAESNTQRQGPEPRDLNDIFGLDDASPMPVDCGDKPVSLFEELQWATHSSGDIRESQQQEHSDEQLDLVMARFGLYLPASQAIRGDDVCSENTRHEEERVLAVIEHNTGVTAEANLLDVERQALPMLAAPDEVLGEDEGEKSNSELHTREDTLILPVQIYQDQKSDTSDINVKRFTASEGTPGTQKVLAHPQATPTVTASDKSTSDDDAHRGSTRTHARTSSGHVAMPESDRQHMTSRVEEHPVCEPVTFSEPRTTLKSESENTVSSGYRQHDSLSRYPQPSSHDEPPQFACHVCTELIPVIHRISRRVASLESLPLRLDEARLRQDVDKVFAFLYASLDDREAELLKAVDEVYGDPLEDEVRSLLDQVQTVSSYCQTAFVFSSKWELLELSGVILHRADELLTKGVAVLSRSSGDADFVDNDIVSVVEEVEVFGKVFNVKDVDDAVRTKSFPKEHTGVDAEPDANASDVRDGFQRPLSLEDSYLEHVFPPGPDYDKQATCMSQISNAKFMPTQTGTSDKGYEDFVLIDRP